MTGAVHNDKSEFIYKVDKQTDVNNYVLAHMELQKLAIPSAVTRPTSDDYQEGIYEEVFC